MSIGDWPLVAQNPARTNHVSRGLEVKEEFDTRWKLNIQDWLQTPTKDVMFRKEEIKKIRGRIKSIVISEGLAFVCVTVSIKVANKDSSSPHQMGYTHTGRLFAIDTDKGRLRWSVRFDSDLSCPAVAEEYVLVGTRHGVYALKKISGAGKWRFQVGSQRISRLPGPTVSDGVVYVGSHPPYREGNQGIYAIDLRDGGLLWEIDDITGDPTAIAAHEDVVYVGVRDTLYALDSKFGFERWRFTPPAPGFQRSYVVPPVVANDTVYIGANTPAGNNKVYALNALTGETIWQFKADEYIVRSPAVDKNMVVVPSGHGRLWAVDTDQGTELWQYKMAGGSTYSTTIASEELSPVITDGVVYHSANSNTITALDVSNGSKHCQFVADESLQTSEKVTDNALFTGDSVGTIYSLTSGGL